MRKLLLPIVFLLIGILMGVSGYYIARLPGKSPLIPQVVKEKARPLDKYTYENLKKRDWQPTEIKIESELDQKTTSLKPPYKFKSYLFSFLVDGKRVTGALNLPNLPYPSNSPNPPIVLLFRGYAPKESYTTGTGTKNAAAVFAQNGFITIAPDFLGYGGSDPRSEDEMIGRFESYPIALTLLKTLSQENIELISPDPSIENWKLKIENLFMWGHSNGGHIALSALEISGLVLPTTLWAPVSKPFPFSTLFFTDEADDLGKLQRKNLAKFEEDYDVNLYSPHNYLDWINAPIQLHQGGADEEVPYWWSRELSQELKKRNKDITYYLYPGANHNMQPGWNTVIARDIAFFKKHMVD